MANDVAPKGAVWVCQACGKRSKDKYGERAIDRGWDASCMMNSVLCDESSLEFGEHGRVVKAEAWKDGQEEVQAGDRARE